MSNAELIKKITDIPKGKSSLAEALKELELSKEAFTHAGNIQQRLNTQESWINEIKNSLSHLVPSSFFLSKIEELTTQLDKTLKTRVEELSITVITQLNNKMILADAENMLSKKVSWAPFNNLSQQVGLMKSRMDKHIYADFESFKTKMKLENSERAISKNPLDPKASEEITQIKNRLTNMEQQIQQIFNEEELIDEDYDSQEELDNMMNDLERVVEKEKKSVDTLENLAPKVMDSSEIVEVRRPAEKTYSKEEIQIDTRPHVFLKTEESNGSPKNKPVSRPESKAMVRRNSKESSVGSKGVGTSTAIRQLTKKIALMQKEIDDNKLIFEEFKNEIQKTNELILKNELKITDNSEKLKEFNERLEVMQASFLRAIRRSGGSKEKPSEPKEKLAITTSSKDKEKFFKEFDEKFRRLIKIENESSRMSTDVSSIKVFLKDKLNEIVSSINSKADMIYSIQKEFEQLKKSTQSHELQCNQHIAESKGEIARLNGPLTDLISDQHRESMSVREELRRNQDVFRAMIEEYIQKPESLRVPTSSLQEYLREKNETHRNSHSRVNSATPTLSVKHRYYKSNGHAEGINPEENWLSYMPDGKAVWLPRVPKSAGRTERIERKACTPDLEAKKN